MKSRFERRRRGPRDFVILLAAAMALSIMTIFKEEKEFHGEKSTNTNRGTSSNEQHNDERLTEPLRRSRKARKTPTFLVGIPTSGDRNDEMRVRLARETYLSFYKDDADTPHRICSLNDLLNGKVLFDECQMAYAFFTGANPNGPTELLSPNKSYPILAKPPKNSSNQDDFVYLNVKENQHEGKMPTWFKYATMVVEERKFPFDYIAKVDSDTLLLTPMFLEFAESHMQDTSKLVMAGLPMFDYFCEPKEKNHPHPCPMMLPGGLFISGELFALSSDLAKIMVSNECDRSHNNTGDEDVDMSNWAYHCTATTTNSTVHLVPVYQQQILRQKKSVDAWQPKFGHRFTNVLWTHSSVLQGGYFKKVEHQRELWSDFLEFWRAERHTRNNVSFIRGYQRYSTGSIVLLLPFELLIVCCPTEKFRDIYELPNSDIPHVSVRCPRRLVWTTIQAAIEVVACILF